SLSRDDYAIQPAQRWKHRSHFLVELDDQNSEPGHGRVSAEQGQDPVRVARPFENRDLLFQLLFPSEQPNGNDLARVPVDVYTKLARVFHRFPVQREDYVLEFETGRFRRATWDDVRHHDSPVLFQIERRCERWRDGLGDHANLTAAHASVFADLLVDA